MTARAWSFVLSWSRVGINALLFIVAARALGLEALGLFAIAFAPIRLVQGLHKAGIGDAVIVLDPDKRAALFTLSLLGGLGFTALFATLGAIFSPLLLALSVIPLCHSLGAVAEGVLRQSLAIRALALRTLVIQSGAAGLALSLLASGAGPWALVAFAIANATLTALVSLRLARWRPQVAALSSLRTIWPTAAPLLGRVLLTTGQIPLAQLAIGLALGPVAAGAFQIASRMLDLIEAVTTSPLRYIALPQLRTTGNLSDGLRQHLHRSALLGAWIWGGTAMATLPLLALAVGPAQALAAAPVLQALCGAGLLTALTMPLVQALTAQGHLALVLKREAATLGLSILLILPALTVSATTSAVALTTAALLANLWFVRHALGAFALPLATLAPTVPPLLAATAMCALLQTLPPTSLAMQILAGTSLYAGLMLLFHWHRSHRPMRAMAPFVRTSSPTPPNRG
ncbi:MAG: oligosaccharide flippase family protein [Pseudomonadota bacterium]